MRRLRGEIFYNETKFKIKYIISMEDLKFDFNFIEF